MAATILPSGLVSDFTPGERVVVRYRLPAPPSASAVVNCKPLSTGGSAQPVGKLFTDVIGIVQNVDETGITLRKDAAGYERGGIVAEKQMVVIPLADIERAKRVPPRPMARISRHDDAE